MPACAIAILAGAVGALAGGEATVGLGWWADYQTALRKQPVESSLRFFRTWERTWRRPTTPPAIEGNWRGGWSGFTSEPRSRTAGPLSWRPPVAGAAAGSPKGAPGVGFKEGGIVSEDQVAAIKAAHDRPRDHLVNQARPPADRARTGVEWPD